MKKKIIVRKDMSSDSQFLHAIFQTVSLMSNSTLAGFYTERIHYYSKFPWNLAKRISSTQRRARILEKKKKKTFSKRKLPKNSALEKSKLSLRD